MVGSEKKRVVADEPAVGLGLRRRQLERLRALVIAVGPEVVDRLLDRAVRARPAVAAPDEVGRPAQVVRRVVGPQVGAVAEDRAVLHQAVVEEDLLPALDVPLGVDDGALWIDHALRDRRLRLVGPQRQEAEPEEAEQHDERHGLDPAFRYEQLPPPFGHAASSVAPWSRGDTKPRRPRQTWSPRLRSFPQAAAAFDRMCRG